MLFVLEKYKFHVKNYRKKFSVSSIIFLKFFLFSHTKNSKFSKSNNKYKYGSKRGIFSGVVQATLILIYPLTHTLIPSNNIKVLSSHPATILTFLPWWFVISKVMPDVLRLIQIESEFRYDLLL